MKKLIAIALTLLYVTASAQWTQQVTNTTANLTAIHFPTPTTGYISGNFGGYGGYLKTTDGGNTWASELITFAPFESIHFANADTGTAAGYNVFFTTSSAGTLWSNPAPPTPYLTDVYHVTGKKILVSGGSWLYQTTDAGVNWTGSQDTVSYDGFFFTSPSTGYAAGWDGTFAYRGVISKTTDGGATWSRYFLGNYSVLSNVHFPSANVGYAVGNNRVIKTTNAGNSWTILPADSVNNYYTDIYFTSNTTGHVVGQNSLGNPIVMSTTDGGNTWITTVLAASSKNLLSVWCTDQSTCFAAGDSGMVFKTTNNGGVGIVEQNYRDLMKVSIYPNPFTETATLMVEGAALKNGGLRVYDTFGRTVMIEQNIEGSELQVSRNGMTAGMYFYVLEEEGRVVATGKIIVD
jgi:photosystem II stability/assembly factor-like uncharacterized protein